MPDIFNFSDEMKEFFNTLPANVQENIVQSNAKLNSVEDLKAVVENNTAETNYFS